MKNRASIVAGILATLALLLVFFSYIQPDLVVTLANQVWNCF